MLPCELVKAEGKAAPTLLGKVSCWDDVQRKCDEGFGGRKGGYIQKLRGKSADSRRDAVRTGIRQLSPTPPHTTLFHESKKPTD